MLRSWREAQANIVSARERCGSKVVAKQQQNSLGRRAENDFSRRHFRAESDQAFRVPIPVILGYMAINPK